MAPEPGWPDTEGVADSNSPDNTGSSVRQDAWSWAAQFPAANGVPEGDSQAKGGHPKKGHPKTDRAKNARPDNGQPEIGKPDAGQPDSGQPGDGQPDTGPADEQQAG